MQKSLYLRFLNLFGVFSLFLLITVLAVYFYSPTFKSNASESDTISLGATIEAVASVTLDTHNLEFEFTPNSTGVFDSKPVTATARTNSENGYEMYFSSVNNDTDMVSTEVSDVIASDFSGTVTSTTMQNNKWGYSLDNTDFSPIPAKSNQLTLKNIDHLPETAAEKTAVINIGIKVDNTLPASTYSKDLIFSVLAHEVVINKNRLIELMSMQDPNLSTFCSATYTPTKNATVTETAATFNGDLVPEARLKDTRDNNVYTVRKLADGNCWMTENLRLDLSTGRTLTNSDTDLNAKTTFTPNYNTQTNTGTSWATFEDKTRSYHSESATAGNFYNWYAVTAGSGLISSVNAIASDSICPYGWKLPESQGATKSWENLLTVYSLSWGDIVERTPFNTYRSGLYKDTGVTGTSGGYYWTSQAHNTDNTAAGNGPLLRKGDKKNYGFNTRCVAR